MPTGIKIDNQEGSQLSSIDEWWRQHIKHRDTGVGINPRLYNKFAVTELDYPRKQMFDALARMLGFVAPCSAVLPNFETIENKEVLRSILVAFNETIHPNIMDKINIEGREILGQLAAISSGSGNKVALLSKIMPMHEYQVGTNYGNLCRVLEEEFTKCAFSKLYNRQLRDKFNEIFSADLQEALKELFAACYTYSVALEESHRRFNDPNHNNSSLVDGTKKFNKALNEFWDSASEFVRPIKVAFCMLLRLPDGSNIESSVAFMKLNLVLEEVVSQMHDVLGSACGRYQTQHDKCKDSFVRAMIDIEGVSSCLKRAGIIGEIEIKFVRNNDLVHCELAILNHLLHPYEGNYVEIAELLKGRYIGISKLSCVQCVAILDFMELRDHIRGGHGIWCNRTTPGHYPSWNFSEEKGSFKDHMNEWLVTPAKRLDALFIDEKDKKNFIALDSETLAYYNREHADAFSVHGDDCGVYTTRRMSIAEYENHVDVIKWFQKMRIGMDSGLATPHKPNYSQESEWGYVATKYDSGVGSRLQSTLSDQQNVPAIIEAIGMNNAAESFL